MNAEIVPPALPPSQDYVKASGVACVSLQKRGAGVGFSSSWLSESLPVM